MCGWGGGVGKGEIGRKQRNKECEMTVSKTPPRIEYMAVTNYRALKNLELRGITPLTVFLGPNGSGKSTIFDVFAFL